MVASLRALSYSLWPTLGVLLLIMTLSGSALWALFDTAAQALDVSQVWRDRYLWQVFSFTVWQALLSALLSVMLALPVARALMRRPQFYGREWLLKLFGLPLVIPTIVAIFGIVSVYGQSGWLNQALHGLGFSGWQRFYGLSGILIAHLFFNLPLAVRLLLPSWQAIPAASWRLAAQLNMNSLQLWRWLEWPQLRPVLPGVLSLIFLLCASSFAVVLTLGGGPAASNLEVALYQALRFDFDPGRAVVLALAQVGLCAVLGVLLSCLARPVAVTASAQCNIARPDQANRWGQLWDISVLAVAGLAVSLPLLSVLLSGIQGPVWKVLSDPLLWRSLFNSLCVALPAGLLSLTAGLGVLLGTRRLRLDWNCPRVAGVLEWSGSLVLIIPPLVLGTGLFLLLRPYADVLALGLVLVTLLNALMGLPFVLRVLAQPLLQVAQQHDVLCRSLNLHGWRRAYWVEWPLLRRPLALALALPTSLALGDLGVIALFGSGHTQTLPLLLYQRLSSYQMGQAAVTALVLVGLCLGLFYVIERGLGGGSSAGHTRA